MTRKNRQKHRQFAPRSSSQTHPTSCHHGRWYNRSTALVAALRLHGRADLMETGPSPGFGTLLRRYRQAAGLSQEELAERAGLSARTVGDLERGVSHAPRKDALC
jgi:DNA-binding XRE family transcriptional regulator